MHCTAGAPSSQPSAAPGVRLASSATWTPAGSLSRTSGSWRRKVSQVAELNMQDYHDINLQGDCTARTAMGATSPPPVASVARRSRG